MNVHFSSQTNEWATPQAFFDTLDAEFHFTLDTAATPENAKCKRYFTKESDGLAQSWDNEIVFCNPPYGREIGKWVKKGSEATGGGSSYAASGADRHAILPRTYLQQSRNLFPKRQIEVRGLQKLGTVSVYGGDI